MNFVDRQPKHPGRVKIEPESGGSSFFAKITRADEATVAGTPINATTLTNLYTDRAPAGYGLGGAVTKSLTDFDVPGTELDTGWYYFGETTTNKPTGATLGVAEVMRRKTTSREDVFVVAYCFVPTVIAYRQCVDGAWGEWQYLTYRMLYGTEYATTERYKGNVVYTKLIRFGTLPQSDSKSVDHNVENFGELVDVRGKVVGSSGAIWYDLQSGGGGSVIDVYVSTGQITVTTSGSHDLDNCDVIIKYTKSS